MNHTSISGIRPLPDDPTMPYVDPRHPFEVSRDMVSYTFPLSTGQFAQLLLPRNVSTADARRFQEFVFCACVATATYYDPDDHSGETGEA